MELVPSLVRLLIASCRSEAEMARLVVEKLRKLWTESGAETDFVWVRMSAVVMCIIVFGGFKASMPELPNS